MRTIRETVAKVADRIRGWLYFTAFAAMVSALWAAAWAQSLERDFDRTWLAPAVWSVDPAEEGLAEVTRCNAGAGPADDPDSLWALEVLTQAVPATRPSSHASEVTGLDTEP